jgi:hypothetical protein
LLDFLLLRISVGPRFPMAGSFARVRRVKMV